MRKACFFRKNEEAVSPVIATILLVAITVVLAAVLYVLVLNIFITPPITQIIGLSQSTSDLNFTLSVVSVGGTAPYLNSVFIVVFDASGNQQLGTLLSDINGTWNNNVRFNDVNHDSRLNVPDNIQLRKGSSYFDVGSKIIITNVGGTTTYVSIELI